MHNGLFKHTRNVRLIFNIYIFYHEFYISFTFVLSNSFLCCLDDNIQKENMHHNTIKNSPAFNHQFPLHL